MIEDCDQSAKGKIDLEEFCNSKQWDRDSSDLCFFESCVFWGGKRVGGVLRENAHQERLG